MTAAETMRRLEAAAPQLLDACRAALEHLDAQLYGRPEPLNPLRLASSLRGALSDATGEPVSYATHAVAGERFNPFGRRSANQTIPEARSQT
jgi:hypothetical protein